MTQRVLFIGLVWPEPETTAAGSRILQLVRFFLDHAVEVHFATTALRTDYTYSLEDLGVRTHAIELNDSSFDRWILDLDPGIVVFDRFVTEEQFSWRVRENCPEALRILDTEDLHFLRESRRHAILGDVQHEPNRLFSDITLRELGSIYRSDLSLIISEFEMKLLKADYGLAGELLHYLPLLHFDRESSESVSSPSFDERIDFMTIGNWKHAPNKDSIHYLKSEIWPAIHAVLPEARMHVYGAYGPGEKSEVHDPEQGFLIKGWNDSKSEAFSTHRVCLAPLRYGAGLKGKLFDSLRFGTPSVTTSIGVEGISDPDSWSGFVCDAPEGFASAAIQLYSDEKIWNKVQSRADKILNDRFDAGRFLPELKKRIQELLEDLSGHRRKNLAGAMLWHHSAQSTKYLSKWIEAKNKNKS